jgi:hypothetical protein
MEMLKRENMETNEKHKSDIGIMNNKVSYRLDNCILDELNRKQINEV